MVHNTVLRACKDSGGVRNERYQIDGGSKRLCDISCLLAQMAAMETDGSEGIVNKDDEWLFGREVRLQWRLIQ